MLELKECEVGKGKVLYAVDRVQIGTGRLTALIGANGSGKSTLLDAIALGHEDKGSITFDGTHLSHLTNQQRSHYVALVESRFSGAEYLSTREYLELGRFPHTGFRGILEAEDKAVVDRIAANLQLEYLFSQSTLTLSDGERQRASIARALIQETPVILLDEPTSFLDYPNKRSIMRMLNTVAKQGQKTVLLASHDLELCLEFCDDCLIINPLTKQLEKYASNELTLEQLIHKAFPGEAK